MLFSFFVPLLEPVGFAAIANKRWSPLDEKEECGELTVALITVIDNRSLALAVVGTEPEQRAEM